MISLLQIILWHELKSNKLLTQSKQASPCRKRPSNPQLKSIITSLQLSNVANTIQEENKREDIQSPILFGT